MKRIIIICEGPTEQEFCNKILSPCFAPKQIYIRATLIAKSNGGIVRWESLKRQIENQLKQDADSYVSLLIDYYGINEKHGFPAWKKSLAKTDKNERMAFLEQQMKEAIEGSLRYRFIPYIQLHEFEGLLFNNVTVFRRQFTNEELVGMEELQKTLDTFPNPELINDTPQNAPSKRLQRIIKGYSKVSYGNILAEAIGLPVIRSKCPRFNAWLHAIASA
ncbi:MAG: DUF4276 family protein [Prevotellaceae bacterium]|jgi:hypothetical protein|nr:DUF4276 family protein [Prevotellaceae bacterium]